MVIWYILPIFLNNYFIITVNYYFLFIFFLLSTNISSVNERVLFIYSPMKMNEKYYYYFYEEQLRIPCILEKRKILLSLVPCKILVTILLPSSPSISDTSHYHYNNKVHHKTSF